MPILDEHDSLFCEKCKKVQKVRQFYRTNNLIDHPDGYIHVCRKCFTMHVDNWDKKTYLPLLEEIDVPYVPHLWNDLMRKYAKDPTQVSGNTIFGRYISLMRLEKWRDFRWKDNEFIQKMLDKQIADTLNNTGTYSEAEIQQKIQESHEQIEAMVPPAVLPVVETQPSEQQSEDLGRNPITDEPIDDYFARQSGADKDPELDLTEEDRTYLRLKWGKTYKPEEWVWLEQLYNEMMDSYDIQSAGHIDNLKLLCKTSLKCNQLIDIGDVEGYQKMSKVYDALMKSGKFTAAQNKAEKGEFVDSVGELVALCEQEGYIERYYVSEAKDKVDETLADMKRYTKTLVSEETNLNNLVEQALKDIDKEDKEEEAAGTGEGQEVEFDDDTVLDDAAFEEFSKFEDDSAEADDLLLSSLGYEEKEDDE